MKRYALCAVGLTVILAASGLALQKANEKQVIERPVSLVMVEDDTLLTTVSGAGAAIYDYLAGREKSRAEDALALREVIGEETLSAALREDAAEQLKQLVAFRESESALETALAGVGYTPCAAVVSKNVVTVLVAREELTREEAVMILNMAQAHTGFDADKITIMTGDMI